MLAETEDFPWVKVKPLMVGRIFPLTISRHDPLISVNGSYPYITVLTNSHFPRDYLDYHKWHC